MNYLAFAVATLPALQTDQCEPIYRCAYCSAVVHSDIDPDLFPYCSDECGVSASAENDEEGV